MPPLFGVSVAVGVAAADVVAAVEVVAVAAGVLVEVIAGVVAVVLTAGEVADVVVPSDEHEAANSKTTIKVVKITSTNFLVCKRIWLSSLTI